MSFTTNQDNNKTTITGDITQNESNQQPIIMREVVNPIARKEYFYRTQDEFGDDEFTKGKLIINTESVDSGHPYIPPSSHTTYFINGVNVAHNIWLPKTLEPKPPEWAIMREVINPINRKEYFYRTQDEFGDNVFTKGQLIINTESLDSGHPYIPPISHTTYFINGVNVASNIWLPKK